MNNGSDLKKIERQAFSNKNIDENALKQYVNLFIDKDYSKFLDKYLDTDTLKRLKYITQFCGCDYNKLYSPLFLYTRFDHSLVTAHMTWHFTHDKKETIIVLLHDIGTPCFAHCIDYVFGDYINQESSEIDIIDMLKKDDKIVSFLKEDSIGYEDFKEYQNLHILENKSPKLCTDRLDGILRTYYIGLHTHSLQQIKEVYDNIIVLKNEENNPEIGFKDIEIAEKFVVMVYNYAKELQGNTDKYISKYVSEIVKMAFDKKYLSLEDLYVKKEEICKIFNDKFSSWRKFNVATVLNRTNDKLNNVFYISFETKKRNSIPLVCINNGYERIDLISSYAKEKYNDSKYAYIKEIDKID